MEINTKPFLFLLFKEQSYKITEGWDYSEEETSIHDLKQHSAIDFALPRGTEVLAPADGWAISSYTHFPALKDDEQIIYKGKPVGFGLGRFIQIYHPESGLFTQLGHLEKVAPEIPFFTPQKRGEFWWPVGHKILPDRLIKEGLGILVKKGQVIGYVGDSGLTWGYNDYPNRPNPEKNPSWDETHIHFEVFIRTGSKRNKKRFDPYGIESDFSEYPDSERLDNTKNMGTKNLVLWITNQESLPKFSK